MTFHVIDLISQVFAIEEKFIGQSDTEIIEWLQQKGTLYKFKKRSALLVRGAQSPEAKQLFRFYSYLGFEATFFIDNGKFFFIGDHCTFRPRRIS
ncbi:hypothetical protein [Pleurocapsa sp. PCC 7319]|uniref:hypothetical protein n=1 Tax=Pleurocapsa sp. PCC 7319 TaxID=118161 RepID=UPI00036B818A|nr:hypothetical protein [Pleurocapsa sp. PCC 7319]